MGQIDMTELIVAFRNFTKMCLKQHVSGQESLLLVLAIIGAVCEIYTWIFGGGGGGVC
jgi:hypothetical protein